MYHFRPEQRPQTLVLSSKVQVPGHITQYLKSFQIEAIRFLYAHLSKQEFCILNDGSGLGKSASAAVLLAAIATHKKSLIVVQDDDLVVGWQFHFGVLTNMPVKIIKDGRDSTDSHHSAYLAKWDALRSIGDLSKFNFDLVIVDNRGQMLSNNFCSSMLLRNFEKKVNLVISSTDITAELKLLHNVLRLGGRLDRQYESFKTFEEKFKLPISKSDSYQKGIDLEEYFLKREILSDYCKEFRLRRQRHHYEQMLPLVEIDQYRRNLDLWKTANSLEVRSTPSDKGTEDLFQQFYSIRDGKVLDKTLTQIDNGYVENRSRSLDICDEPVSMSPLLFVSESETEGDEPIALDLVNQSVIEVVDLSSESNALEEIQIPAVKSANISEQQSSTKSKETHSKISSKKSKEINLKADSESKASSPQTKENKTSSTKSTETKPDSKTSMRNSSKGTKTPPERKLRSQDQTSNSRKLLRKTVSKKDEINSKRKTRHENTENTKSVKDEDSRPATRSRKSDEVKVKTINKPVNEKTPNKARSSETASSSSTPKRNGRVPNNQIHKNIVEVTTPKRSLRTHERKNEKIALPHKDETKILRSLTVEFSENESKEPVGKAAKTPLYQKETSPRTHNARRKVIAAPKVFNTRGMQRITRLTGSKLKNKYMVTALSLDIDKKSDSKGKRREKAKMQSANEIKENLKRTSEAETAKEREAKKTKDNNQTKEKITKDTKDTKSTTSSRRGKSSQVSVISSSTNDYEDIQCGQKLSLDEFLIPPTPLATRQSQYPVLLPSAVLYTESEATFVSPGHQDVIVLSSSQDEGSLSSQQSSQSRRTRALKQKNSVPKRLGAAVPTFGAMLSKQQTASKSPDLFSNCSDLGLTLTQANNKSTFEGFKIFGSEVKQFQQLHALTGAAAASTKTARDRDRSCLDILEKMFEPRSSKSNSNAQQSPTRKKLTNRTKTPILPTPRIEAVSLEQLTGKEKSAKRPIVEEEIFEITNNGTFGSMMRFNSSGDISPVALLKATQVSQHNKITNYLIGPTQAEEEHVDRTPPSTRSTRLQLSGIAGSRKSPKSKTQATKLTRWFLKSSGADEVTARTQTENTEVEQLQSKRSTVKRRCLDLSFKK